MVILCINEKNITKSKALKDDFITIYGISLGDVSYTTVMENELTVAYVSVDKIDQ